MHTRLIAIVIPLILVISLVLGGLLLVESARRISAEAHGSAVTDLAALLQHLDRDSPDTAAERVRAPHRLISVAIASGDTVVVGPDGKVAFVKTGYSPDGAEQIAEAIRKLLK